MIKYLQNLINAILLASLLTAANGQNNISVEESSVLKQFVLSGSVIPLAYDIELSKFNIVEKEFKGKIRIVAQVVRNTDKISFHVGSTMSVIKSRVVVDGQRSSAERENTYDLKTEIWTILLKQKLPASSIVCITIIYKGILRADMFGVYKSSYMDETGKEIWLIGTQFQTIYARHAFPCFDEPKYKSTFTISISPPDGYHCLSNMPKKDATGTWITFEESVPMSTYLVAFVISNFKSQSNNNFRVWSRSNALEQSTYSLNIGSKALRYFSKLLDLPYQLKKMDMVAIPDFMFGAMENWGLITYRETSMLYDFYDTSNVDKQRITTTVVHEISHMWFGNLVTIRTWGYMWLNEGFSCYFEYTVSDKIEKNWNMSEQFVVNRHQLVMTFDALADSKPITRNDTTIEEIEKIGGIIVTTKSACIIRMLDKTFGKDIFQAALRNYINDGKYKTVAPSDLWRAFQKQIDAASIDVSIAKAMKNWTETAGFPCVSVTIKPNYILLSQERFFIQKPNPAREEQLWSIPITWLTSIQANSGTARSTKPVRWLSSRNANWTIDNKNAAWTILNVHSAGYYRVNYDKDSWNKIIEALTNGDFEKIPVLNRAAIIDDSLNLARAGLLDYDIPLRALQYLRRETNYLPFKSAFGSLDYLLRMFSMSPDADTFKVFLINLFENIYIDLSYNDQSDDDQLTILLRQEINDRACYLQYTYCVETSQRLFNNWMKNKVPISKNQRSAAYCTAIKYGTDVEWTFLWDQYKKSNSATEQITILKALGCSTNTKVLRRYLLTVLKDFSSSLVHRQDMNIIFKGIYSSSMESAEFIIDFASKNYDTLLKYFGGHAEIVLIMLNAMRGYPSKRIVEKVEKLVKTDKRIGQFNANFVKGFDDVNAEIAWFRLHLPIISSWIRTN